MKRVLIAYFSAAGTTEKMAGYIAEGIRFSGQVAVIKKMGEIRDAAEIRGYDGYIFGSPTYSQDEPGAVNAFLGLAKQAGLEGKPGGAFGSYTHDVAYKHDTYAPAKIFETLQQAHKIEPFELGALSLKEDLAGTREGMKACQDYGRIFGEKLEE